MEGIQEAAPAPGIVLISTRTFMQKLGLTSVSRFWELSKKDPLFPTPIRTGRRWRRYVLSECDTYLMTLMRTRGGTQDKAA
jgi:predicted DNA-binding transcriptional regulator AlpA